MKPTMKPTISPTFLVSSILLTSCPLLAALRWDAPTGTYTGGTNGGNAVSNAGGFVSGTASGYTGMCLDQTNPHTFATFQGTDLGLCHDLSFTDSNGNPVLVTNLQTAFGNICFNLVNPLAAGETINMTFDFNTPIGTWEAPGFASPTTGSNAQFATSLRNTNLAADPTDKTYNDIIFGFSTSSTPVAPVGQTPGPWDYSTAVNPNGGTASTRTISGSNNEFVDFNFVNGPGPSDVMGAPATQFKAVVRDDNSGTNNFNFTDRISWSITAGADGLPTNAAFKLTLDGTPLAPVPVPEPSRGVLLLLGVASVSCFRRRR